MYVRLIPREVFKYGDQEFVTGWSVRVHEDETDSEPVASCQARLVGDRGLIYGIQGSGFYQAFDEFMQKARELGMKTVEGYVSRAHVRLLTRQFGADRVRVTHVGEPTEGFRWPWVVVSV